MAYRDRTNQIHVQLNESVNKKLKALAASQRRTVTNYLGCLIEDVYADSGLGEKGGVIELQKPPVTG